MNAVNVAMDTVMECCQ